MATSEYFAILVLLFEIVVKGFVDQTDSRSFLVNDDKTETPFNK
jgi:hypothetical protein